jgi:hypothetical protein
MWSRLMRRERIHGPRQSRRGAILRRSFVAVVVVVAVAGCSEADDAAETVAAAEGCADVVDAAVERSGDRFVVTATIQSADTGWDRYADAWQIRTTDGDVLGTRVLAHPHVDEQPFTRSLTEVEIPADVTTVEIAARDSVVGFCGTTVTVAIPAP